MFSRGLKPLELKTPYPFYRRVLLDYVTKEGRTFVIPTGEWIKELGKKPVLLDSSGSSYDLLPVPISMVNSLFKEKYGIVHVLRYFENAPEAKELVPSKNAGENKYGLREYFNSVAGAYEDSITGNPVQLYMRNISTKVLSEYAGTGQKVLDLGCGIMLESIIIAEKVDLSCADVSDEMLKIARSRWSGGKNVQFYETTQGLEGVPGVYSLIFCTYGLLELVRSSTLRNFLDNHLTSGGLFIGTFWNRFGMQDNMLALLKGNFSYLKEKLSGQLSGGLGRYPLYTELKDYRKVLPKDDYEIVETDGICVLTPPYNYLRLSQNRRLIEALSNLDRAVSGMGVFRSIGDYTLVVARKK